MRHRSWVLVLVVSCSLLSGATPAQSLRITFRALDGGRAAVQDIRIRALVVAQNGTLYAGGMGTASVVDASGNIVNPHGPRGSAFLVSHDHGATWTIRLTPASALSPMWTDHTRWPINFTVYQMAVDPQHPRTIYAAGVTNGGGFHSLVRSVDGSHTWQDVLFYKRIFNGGNNYTLQTNIVVTPTTRVTVAQLGRPVGITLVIDPRDPRRLYLGTATAGVLRSTDAGTSWIYNSRSPSVLTGVAEQLVLDPQRTQTLYALVQGTTFAQLYRTDDGGMIWRSLWHGGYASGVLLEGSTLYLVRSDGIYASTDRGTHWRLAVNARALPGFTMRTTFGLAGTVVQALHHAGVWYAVDNNAVKPDLTGLFATSTAGASWRLLTTGLRGPQGALAGPIDDGNQTVMWIDAAAHPPVLLTASQVNGLYRWSVMP